MNLNNNNKMRLKRRIHNFVDKVHDTVTLPNMDEGEWKEDGQCCFGARIAKVYDNDFYTDGEEKMQQELGLDAFELNSILWMCGSHYAPFSAYRWDHTPKHVINNLLKIERKPTTREFEFITETRLMPKDEKIPRLLKIMRRIGLDPADEHIELMFNQNY